MAEDQKKTTKDFQDFCQGMPCADMMRKMMEAKKPGHPFKCAEMMSQMMQMCGKAGKKKEGPHPQNQEE